MQGASSGIVYVHDHGTENTKKFYFCFRSMNAQLNHSKQMDRIIHETELENIQLNFILKKKIQFIENNDELLVNLFFPITLR